jgi:RNA-directed DNA polymerase
VDFLGFTFRYDRDRLGRGHRYLNVFPSKKALKRACEKVRELTSSSRCFMPIPFLIGDLRRVLRGWRNYFAHGYPRHAFRRLNWYVMQRLHGHLERRSQRRYRLPDGVPLTAHLQALGWQPL